ncbi:hypothetical protein BJF85_07745 [Saccharomonospora sp. CUA-673]|nr:hypothetical protein BJF85_07745 [Saccharomonospora sp. CUA-673]
MDGTRQAVRRYDTVTGTPPVAGPGSESGSGPVRACRHNDTNSPFVTVRFGRRGPCTRVPARRDTAGARVSDERRTVDA